MARCPTCRPIPCARFHLRNRRASACNVHTRLSTCSTCRSNQMEADSPAGVFPITVSERKTEAGSPAIAANPRPYRVPACSQMAPCVRRKAAGGRLPVPPCMENTSCSDRRHLLCPSLGWLRTELVRACTSLRQRLLTRMVTLGQCHMVRSRKLWQWRRPTWLNSDSFLSVSGTLLQLSMLLDMSQHVNEANIEQILFSAADSTRIGCCKGAL